MRKFVVLAAVAGLLVGSLAAPADAQKKKKKKSGPTKTERTVEGDYALPPLIVAGTCAQSGAVGCVSLPSTSEESYVTASVTDAHGQPVYVSVSANTDGNVGDDETYGFFCGETTQPLVFPPGTELHFWIGFQADPNVTSCQPGAATTGTVTATFSNLP